MVPPTRSITILVTGDPGAGKSALCRRFVDKVFDPTATGSGSGQRNITINEETVVINIVDAADAEGNKGAVDGIVYVVDGLGAEDAFTPLSHFVHGLYDHASTVAASDDVWPMVSLPMSSCASLMDSQPVVSPGAGSAESTAGHSCGGTTVDGSPGGFRRPPRLDTRVHHLPRVQQKPVAPTRDTLPPMCVVVSKWDELRTRTTERPVVRLHAMAKNWGQANRCQVSFISASSGFGMKNAFTQLIRDIVTRRVLANSDAMRVDQRPSDMA